MKIVAILALGALVGCSRNDKTATVEPVSTVTVTSETITVPLTPTDQELDRRAMLAAAQTMPGVAETVDVPSVLAVTPPDADDQTTMHVQVALLKDPDFVEHSSDVVVHVDRGTVTLQGNTTTPQARTAAERIVMRQEAVVSVNNELRVVQVQPKNAPTKANR
jgi:osmotically-inducible protein OsmY